MRIAAYVRVSSDQQADNLSIPTQIRLLVEYAERQGWDAPTLYEDRGLGREHVWIGGGDRWQ